jgi:hypothetical protein
LKRFTVKGFGVCIATDFCLSLGCAVAYFLFSEGRRFVLIQFCLGGKGGSSFVTPLGMLGLVRLANVLTPHNGY